MSAERSTDESHAGPSSTLLECLSHAARTSTGYPVHLHIYDLGPMSRWILNSWAAPDASLVGYESQCYGAFHVGVEVIGVEWSFQAPPPGSTKDDPGATGITCHRPKMHPRHVYRESVSLGLCTKSFEEFRTMLVRMEQEWSASSYHYIRHNCTDFAQALCEALDLTVPFPAWVHGLAKGVLRHTVLAEMSSPALLGSQSCGSQSCGSESCGSAPPSRALVSDEAEWAFI